jgi:cell division protease FtsH
LKKLTFRDLTFYLLIFLILVATVLTLQNMDAGQSLSYADIRALFERQQVETVEVDGNTLVLTLKDPYNGKDQVTYDLYSFEIFHEDFNSLIVNQWENGIISDYDYPDNPTPPWWQSILPYVALTVLFGILWYFMFLRQAGGGTGADRPARFGRARTRTLEESGSKVTFDDVAGADEEKEELREIVEFLRDPKKFIALGARIPKGVLLVGPPGTGKTLIAKAGAGEAGVHFLSISGSDFVELYVGVGASRVRDLFDQAKKESPAIVFIDEIDAVGRQRGTGLGGGHDEREQTLNQLLVEMDGFTTNEGVIVMAATNRQDILDPALMRPGRFDRQVFVGLPDIRGREAILKVHARNKPLGEDVCLATVAKATGGFTGADLENLMNESALLAARRGERFITMPDLHEAMLKVIAGPEKKSRVLTPHTRRLTAYHEAGPAIVIHSLDTQDPCIRSPSSPAGPRAA